MVIKGINMPPASLFPHLQMFPFAHHVSSEQWSDLVESVMGGRGGVGVGVEVGVGVGEKVYLGPFILISYSSG